GPPGGPRPPGKTAVDEAGQAVLLPPLAAVLDRAGRDGPARRRQLGGLRLLPFGQTGPLGVVLRPRTRSGGRVRPQPVDNLRDVRLPPGGFLYRGGRQTLQPDLRPRPPRRSRSRDLE